MAPAKLVNVVWDGAADWVIDRLLAEGKLPNVARLVSKGVRAESVTPAWPSKTAVGHAAIFTGTWGNVNGITNNSVPLFPAKEHTILENRRGFDGNSLQAEPIWVTGAKAGKKVVALSAAVSYPVESFVEQIKAAGADTKNFIEFSGFETTLAGPKMIKKFEPTITVAGQTFSLRAFDDPAIPTKGVDSIEITFDGEKAVIHASAAQQNTSAWSKPFKIKTRGDVGNAYFRLFSIAPDGMTMELYQRKVPAIRGTEAPSVIEAYTDAYGAHHDDPFFTYQDGMFGKPLYQGGDGEAERRILEIVRQDCEFLKKSFDYGWNKWKPDILLHYTPMSDSAGHTWMGALDPDMPGHNPEMAKKLWPYYEEVYRLQDDWLGYIMDHVDSNTIVSLTSDHGMAGSNKYVYVNQILAAAGLVTFDAQKKIDLSKSPMFVPPWSDFFLVLNRADRKSGIVLPSEEIAFVEKAKKALLSARDPETGLPLFTGVLEPKEVPYLGLGGPSGGDLYFEIAPGFYPSNRQSDVITGKYGDEIGSGTHGFMPFRRSMGAIWIAAGASLPHREISTVRHIDIMPTLCQALGIPAPKNATGHAIGEALGK